MHVPETGPYRHMQCSNRKFLVASISAVVMLGSANSVLAQDASPQSASSPSTPSQEASTDQVLIQKVQTQRSDKLSSLGHRALSDSTHTNTPAFSLVAIAAADNAVINHADGASIPQRTQSNTPSFAADIMHRYGINSIGSELPETIPLIRDVHSTPVFLSSAEQTTTSPSDSTDYSIDPALQESLDALLTSAETLAQDNQSQPSSDVSLVDLAISTPEISIPVPEFASATNSGRQYVESIQTNLIGQSEDADADAEDTTDDLDIEIEPVQSDLIEESEDADAEDADTEDADTADTTDGFDFLDGLDFDSDVSTDAATLLAPPPDYLNSNPNPLFFPTEADEVEIVGSQPITLEQSIALARQNSRELQTAILNLENSEADLREARAARFPTLSVSSDVTHTDNNPAFEQTDAFGNPVDVDNNTTTLNGQVTLDYDLFTSGGRRASIRAAERARQLQELQVEVVTEDIRLNVTNAYYDLQESDEAIRIARADLEESLTSLNDAEARERAGVGTRFDRLQAEVDVANAQQSVRIAISNEQIARRTLADILSLPYGIDISAADEVKEAGIWPLTLEESIVQAFKNRAEPEQQLVQREIERQQRRVARSQTLPQLSLVGQYSLNDLLDDTNTGSDTESFSIAAQVSWLLFDGGATRAAVRGEEIDAELAEIAFADTLESIRLEVETAYSQLGANFENIQTAQIAVEVAQESLRLARLRFQAGVGIQSDVITAQSDLTDAEENLVTAVLDYNRALVAIQRAVSNLDGNLADIP